MSAVKTRKLSDLYRRGKDVTLNDEEGEPVTIWLQKLNPIENETASRNANAARARVLMNAKDHDSVDYMAVMNDILEYTGADLAKFLAQHEVSKITEGLEAEFADEKGWNDEDYLQGLHDSWEEGGLKERYHKQEEEGPDEEAQRCFDEMTRFQTEFAMRIEAEEVNFTEEFKAKPEEVLQQLMAERMFKLQADLAWLMEFRKSELLLGVREVAHHKNRYFKHRDEVDELEAEVIGKLIEEFSSLNVPVVQGKDSQPSQDSSPESSQPETPETEVSSGLVAATV